MPADLLVNAYLLKPSILLRLRGFAFHTGRPNFRIPASSQVRLAVGQSHFLPSIHPSYISHSPDCSSSTSDLLPFKYLGTQLHLKRPSRSPFAACVLSPLLETRERVSRTSPLTHRLPRRPTHDVGICSALSRRAHGQRRGNRRH